MLDDFRLFHLISQGDLKQFLRISRSTDDKLKSHPISTKTKVSSFPVIFSVLSLFVWVPVRCSVLSLQVSICAQVAHGMDHLSRQRFVHKDLAARNCLISGQRHVKISSLSLSQDVYSRLETLLFLCVHCSECSTAPFCVQLHVLQQLCLCLIMCLCFSEYYHYRQAWIPLRWLPAESVFENNFSAKSDVWAFGVLMWEVFSLGELPYNSLNDDNVMEGKQSTDRTSPVS